MALANLINYNPTLKTITVEGDVSSAQLTSIINITRSKDLYVVGQTAITDRVYTGGNTTFTLDTNTTGDSETDVLAVRYQINLNRIKSDWDAVQGSLAEILNRPNLGTAALASIEDFATAAQGSKADNSVQLTGNQSIAGTKTFTSPLILPNNSRINGVEHFYQTTKPTTRGDGSALVVRDRWYKTDDGTQWFWNGTYWLSPPLLSPVINSTSQFSIFVASEVGPYNLFVSSVFWSGKTASNNSSSAYWVLRYMTYDNNGANTVVAEIRNTRLMPANRFFNLEIVDNRFIPTSDTVENSLSITMNVYYYRLEVIGVPGGALSSLQVKYHLVI